MNEIIIITDGGIYPSVTESGLSRVHSVCRAEDELDTDRIISNVGVMLCLATFLPVHAVVGEIFLFQPILLP